MKKMFFYGITALTVLVMFTLTACDKDDNTDPAPQKVPKLLTLSRNYEGVSQPELEIQYDETGLINQVDCKVYSLDYSEAAESNNKDEYIHTATYTGTFERDGNGNVIKINIKYKDILLSDWIDFYRWEISWSGDRMSVIKRFKKSEEPAYDIYTLLWRDSGKLKQITHESYSSRDAKYLTYEIPYNEQGNAEGYEYSNVRFEAYSDYSGETKISRKIHWEYDNRPINHLPFEAILVAQSTSILGPVGLNLYFNNNNCIKSTSQYNELTYVKDTDILKIEIKSSDITDFLYIFNTDNSIASSNLAYAYNIEIIYTDNEEFNMKSEGNTYEKWEYHYRKTEEK